MTIFPTFATIAGKKNNKVCVPVKQISNCLILTLSVLGRWYSDSDDKTYSDFYYPSYVFHELFLLFPAEEGLLYRARYFGDTDLYQRAQRARTPSCAKLSEITASLHGWGCFHKSKFSRLRHYSHLYKHFVLTACMFHFIYKINYSTLCLQACRINTKHYWL